MPEQVQIFATLSAALVAGAALHINVAEHPARMMLHPAIALVHWAPSYRRAVWVQLPLAFLSAVTCVATWMFGGAHVWLGAGLLIGSVVPLTLVDIVPTNRQLVDARLNARPLLDKWSHLNAVRALVSLLSAALMSYALAST